MAVTYSEATSQTTGTVLIVDDDALILQTFERMLSRMGVSAVCAAQWADAIEAVKRENPDLILLDVHMPSVDGPTLLAFLREQGVDVPVFIISAGLDKVDLDKLRALGVHQFVPKPFSVERIQSLILEELRAARSGDDATSGSQTGERAKTEPDAHTRVSSSRPALEKRWRPKWGRRKQTLRQLVVVGGVCLGMSVVFLFAHFMMNSGTILALREVIHQNLRAQTEMTQQNQK